MGKFGKPSAEYLQAVERSIQKRLKHLRIYNRNNKKTSQPVKLNYKEFRNVVLRSSYRPTPEQEEQNRKFVIKNIREIKTAQ